MYIFIYICIVPRMRSVQNFHRYSIFLRLYLFYCEKKMFSFFFLSVRSFIQFSTICFSFGFFSVWFDVDVMPLIWQCVQHLHCSNVFNSSTRERNLKKIIINEENNKASNLYVVMDHNQRKSRQLFSNCIQQLHDAKKRIPCSQSLLLLFSKRN